MESKQKQLEIELNFLKQQNNSLKQAISNYEKPSLFMSIGNDKTESLFKSLQTQTPSTSNQLKSSFERFNVIIQSRHSHSIWSNKWLFSNLFRLIQSNQPLQLGRQFKKESHFKLVQSKRKRLSFILRHQELAFNPHQDWFSASRQFRDVNQKIHFQSEKDHIFWSFKFETH